MRQHVEVILAKQKSHTSTRKVVEKNLPEKAFSCLQALPSLLGFITFYCMNDLVFTANMNEFG